MMSRIRTRVAPSPTGFPHIGTAYQAVFDLAFARKNKGSFILRIEDTDQSRQVTGSEEAIFRGLDWLNLLPDESPRDGGNFGPYRQSERLALYHEYAHQLVKQGDAYYCFCSQERLEEVRGAQEKHHQPPRYDRHCRNIPPLEAERMVKDGCPYVIRLKVPENEVIVVKDLIRGAVSFDSNTIDDQVLLKSDGFPTYHLAVVVDDHLMNITHTVRGEEWIPSAPKHILLYKAFNWEEPIFIHLPLLRSPDRSKISKRDGHTNLDWYREQGFLPQALVNFLASIVWTHPEGKDIYGFDEFIKLFEWENINIASPIFDLRKLEWMNGEYIRAMSPADFKQVLIDWLLNEGGSICPISSQQALIDADKVAEVGILLKERLKRLSEFEEHTSYFFTDSTGVSPDQLSALLEKRGETLETSLIQLSAGLEVLESLGMWSVSGIEEVLVSLKDSNGWQPKFFFMVLRVAICTREVSPPLFDTIFLMGRELTISRLESAIAILKEKI